MTDKPVFFSRDDARVLQQMIAREKRQTVNVPTRQVSDRWDMGEDHQAPDVYVAKPVTSAGIPGLTLGDGTPDYYAPLDSTGNYFDEEPIPGFAVCNVYKIINGEIVLTDREVTVYNVGTGAIEQDYIPVVRDKFGKWLAVSAGGGSTDVTIDFEVTAWVVDDAASVGCDACYATVTRVSCGSSVQVGDQVVIYDLDMCWFILPIQLLIGLRGWAQRMASPLSAYPGGENYCLTAPIDGECMWIVRGLCCLEEVYPDA